MRTGRTGFRFGEIREAYTEFYQPLEPEVWRAFVAPYGMYDSNPYYVYDGSSRLAQYQFDNVYAGADIGYQLAEFGELRIGLFTGSSDTELETGDPSLPEVGFHNAGYRASLVFDQLDNTSFPHSGGYLNAVFTAGRKGFGADENYDAIETMGLVPVTFGRSTISAKARWDSMLNGTEDFNNLFFLGGFQELSGMVAEPALRPAADPGRAHLYVQASQTEGVQQRPLRRMFPGSRQHMDEQVRCEP